MEIREVKDLIDKAVDFMGAEGDTKEKSSVATNTPFDYFYLFSNEDLNYLFKKINVQNKSILTVGSSGDQALYAFANGASKIVHFDVNPFSEVYFDYKVAAIKELEYRDFKRFFNSRKYPILSDELYSRINHNLPIESRLFWDGLYCRGFGTGEYQLHKTDSDYIRYTKEDYYKIKEALLMGEPNIRFINSDLQTIADKLGKDDKFDYILLSNIYHYVDQWQTEIPGREAFKGSVESLCTHLNPGGKIQLTYLWSEVAGNAFFMGSNLGLDNVYPIHSRIDEGSIMYAPYGIYYTPETETSSYDFTQE